MHDITNAYCGTHRNICSDSHGEGVVCSNSNRDGESNIAF